MTLPRTAVLTGVSFAGGVLYAVFARGYPLLLGLFLGAAIAAMVFSIVRTSDRLRSMARRRPDDGSD